AGSASWLKYAGGSRSLDSSAYIASPKPICRRLLVQVVRKERFLALLSAGKSIDARIAMMAMTTSSSIRVKPRQGRREACWENGPGCGRAGRCWIFEAMV